MEINKDGYFKAINDAASNNLKKKNQNQKQEQKHSQASSLEALGSYGKAQLNISYKGNFQSKKETVLKLLKEALETYKNTLNCPKEIKEKFLSEISESLDEFCQNCDEDSIDRIYNTVTESYLFNGYKKDNAQLLEKLFNMKDNKGNLRFNTSNIANITEYISRDSEGTFKTILEAKDKEGNYRFDSHDIAYIISVINKIAPENKDILFTLLEAKDNKGNRRFPYRPDIRNILTVITPDNKDILYTVLEAKDKEGNYRFDASDISILTDIVTPDNKDTFETLLEAKDKEGYYRFDGNNISIMTNIVNPDNKDAFKILLEAKNEKGNFRFDGYDIIEIMKKNITSDDKISLLKTLLEVKDEKGNFRFDASHISDILELKVITPDNKDALVMLLEAKDEKGNCRFNRFDFSSILIHITPDNKDALVMLLEAKDEKGNCRFDASDIEDILSKITPDNKDILKTLLEAKDEKGNCRFDGYYIADILGVVTPENKDIFYFLLETKDQKEQYAFTANYISSILKSDPSMIRSVTEQIKEGEATIEYLKAIFAQKSDMTLKDIKSLERKIGARNVREMSAREISLMYEFKDLINKQNINEIPAPKKKEILRKFVQNNIGMFDIGGLKRYLPLIPANQEEYCSLLPALVKSLGIETNILNDSEIKTAQKNITSLSNSLAELSDEEFNNLTISQKYSTDEFIIDVFNIVKDLKPEERQKVYDYFGFELHHNKNGIQVDNNKRHCFSITGYPMNLNNGKKLAQIDNPETKQIVESLRPYVIKYSKNNKINCNNKEIEELLNQIISVFPELRTQIGKTQHATQDFDLFKHSLKVVQKISQNPDFSNLNASDKKIMLLGGLFHDLTKTQGQIDKIHSNESAFDSFYILKKLKLTKEEEIKLYSLIKNHEWFAYVNNKEANNIEKRMKSVAFDMQYDNLFDLSKIFTLADLKAVKADNSFYDRFIDDFNFKTKEIEKLTNELKKTQPLLPVTKIPKASVIEKAISKVNPDGSTNLKGIYKDKSGLVVIKYNEVENESWDKIGFPKGSFSRGITSESYSTKHGKILKSANVDTGNIKFFAHGLDYSNQLYKFNRFALPDSDALLSVSYTERPESKYRFFRTQGVLLNTDAKYTYGGGETDSGSGCGKDIDNFKKNYVFGGEREKDREYISNLIKTTLDLEDEEYIEFVKKNANKSFSEIEPKETREAIIKTFCTINSNIRRGDREYNEMYISNPEVMAVFAYDENDNVGDISKFISKQKDFLKQYALDNDLAFVVFGD